MGTRTRWPMTRWTTDLVQPVRVNVVQPIGVNSWS